MIAWLLLASFLVAPDDDAVVARIADQDLLASDFGSWMVARHGHAHMDDWVLEQLILEEARLRDLAPDAATTAAALDAEVQSLADRYFRGDVDAWRADKARRGVDPDGFLARRGLELEVELCLDALALQDREITEEQLRERYDAMYGSLEESATVEVLFYDLYASVSPDDERPDLAVLDREALERAEAARAALASGTSFDELLAESDPVSGSEFVEHGRVRNWRRNLLGTEMEQAVNSLDRPGELAPVVKVWNGYWVVRLVGRREVTFELLHDELLAELMAEPPTAEEHNHVRSWLRETYPVEILLR